MIIARSLFITLIISLLFGFALQNVFGFFESTCLAFGIQFVGSFIASSYKINRIQLLSSEFQAEIDQLASLSEVTIACPCGNNTFTENIFPNVESTYNCEKCNNEFKIDVNITPTLVTNPVDINKTFADLTKETDKALSGDVDDVSITQEYTKGTEL
jgi:transcription elongation factor Elf1